MHIKKIFLIIAAAGLFSAAPALADTQAYKYDNAGRLASVDYGDGSFVEYSYDLSGNLVSLIRGTGGMGNVHPDASVDLKDAILALQIMADMQPDELIVVHADVNGDILVGMAEALYVLQQIAVVP